MPCCETLFGKTNASSWVMETLSSVDWLPHASGNLPSSLDATTKFPKSPHVVEKTVRLPRGGPIANIAHGRMHAHRRMAAVAAAHHLTARGPMERGLLAPLSPNEELALRRIAQGSTEVPDVYSRRLVRLALIKRDLSGLRLTELGKKRLAGLSQGPPPD